MITLLFMSRKYASINLYLIAMVELLESYNRKQLK